MNNAEDSTALEMPILVPCFPPVWLFGIQRGFRLKWEKGDVLAISTGRRRGPPAAQAVAEEGVGRGRLPAAAEERARRRPEEWEHRRRR